MFYKLGVRIHLEVFSDILQERKRWDSYLFPAYHFPYKNDLPFNVKNKCSHREQILSFHSIPSSEWMQNRFDSPETVAIPFNIGFIKGCFGCVFL